MINWGMLPFLIQPGDLPFKNLDYLFIPGIKKAVEDKAEEIIIGFVIIEFFIKP